MKRFFKIFGISIGAIIGVTTIALVVACNIIFTPSKLTRLVRNNANRFVSCQVDIDTARLTFFSTFPHFSLTASNVVAINPMPGAPNDTLIAVRTLSLTIDALDYLRNKNITLSRLILKDAKANIFTSDNGNNYDVFTLQSDTTDNDTTAAFNLLALSGIDVKAVSATYVDGTSGLNARIDNLQGSLSAHFADMEGEIDAALSFESIAFDADQRSDSAFATLLNNLTLTVEGTMHETINAIVDMNVAQLTTRLNGDTLTRALPLRLHLPLEASLPSSTFATDAAHCSINNNTIGLKAQATLNDTTTIDATVDIRRSRIGDWIALVPDAYAHYLEGITLDGDIALQAHIAGEYADSIMPDIAAHLALYNAKAAYPQAFPYEVTKVNTQIDASIDLNEANTRINAKIKSLSAQANEITLAASGSIDDLLGSALCNIAASVDFALENLLPFVPESIKLEASGNATAQLNARFALDDLLNMNLKKIKAEASIDYDALSLLYNDSIRVKDRSGNISLSLPSNGRNPLFKELFSAQLNGTQMKVHYEGMVDAEVRRPQLNVGMADFADTTQALRVHCNFNFASLQGSYDTINFNIAHPKGELLMFPSQKSPADPDFKIDYHSNNIIASMGNEATLQTGNIDIAATTDYDPAQTSTLFKYNPRLNVNLNAGALNYAGIETNISIPSICFDFEPNFCNIHNSRIVIDESDFSLAGKITHLRDYFNDEGLLEANLNFTSSQTNIDQLMDLVNGFGNNDLDTTATNVTDSTEEANPFIVPKGVLVNLNTNIDHALFNGSKINNVNGKVIVFDGVLVLEQIGFTSDAAEMQLTGIYRSERRNHLFAGIDFHLLNIDIAELIRMIPAVDEITPMLRSFEGNAEFHLAAETYLTADYKPKMSTLRAAAALEGHDLVLLDNETFSTIAKYLMFNKKTRNIVDSLSVEMTVFRNEIDIYPFLITMDKWQAVLAGRHNMDMSFNYHISLTDCPLPARLGLNITGTFDDLKYTLVPCQYKALYKPDKRKPTDERVMALKRLIADSLKANVK